MAFYIDPMIQTSEGLDLKDWLIFAMVMIAVLFFTYQRLDGDEARQESLQLRVQTLESQINLLDEAISSSIKVKPAPVRRTRVPLPVGRPLILHPVQ